MTPMSTTSSLRTSRRDFLRQACCAGVGTAGLLSAAGQLRVLGAIAGDSLATTADSTDYKALVCLFLRGGNDATNLIVPADGADYAAYAKARAELAIPQSQLLPISPRRYGDGRKYAVHGSAAPLQGLFADGKLAVLANVGMLVRPTTLADYQAGRNLPPQLFSHSDQTLQWQSSVPDKPFETGWGGRLADIIDAMNANNQISMSITLNGTNSFQRGRLVSQFAVNPTGVGTMDYGLVTPELYTPRSAGMKAVMAVPHTNALAAAFGAVTGNAIADTDLLSRILQTTPGVRTAFPPTAMGTQLAMITRLISVAPNLGLKRQIFFVGTDGWDMHAAQIGAHGSLLAELAGAMRAFYDATVELGVANQVTTFTASDFGRTYVPNAGGTDHGWGNHQLIMGGAVRGGDIYGQMPSLVVNGPDDVGRGRWIPSSSVDEYNATLAAWFGVSPSNLPIVLPNIGRFPNPDLGFLG